MLPNFLIIGAQKAATTWLAKCLGEHPDVFMVDIKEVRFFNRYFARGVEWYESNFSGWSGQAAVGEGTPGYIYFPQVAGRIKATLGDDVKLIASLRNPVDRAYSAFWMFLSHGDIPVDAEFRTCFQQDRNGLRTRGNYFVQLSRYMERFAREDLLVLIHEEVKQDSQRALSDCFQFLGVDAQFAPDSLSTRVNKALDVSVAHHQVWRVRRALGALPLEIERPLISLGHHVFRRLPKQRDYTPLDEELGQELLVEFMSDIEQLECLLGRDLSIWYGASRA